MARWAPRRAVARHPRRLRGPCSRGAQWASPPRRGNPPWANAPRGLTRASLHAGWRPGPRPAARAGACTPYSSARAILRRCWSNDDASLAGAGGRPGRPHTAAMGPIRMSVQQRRETVRSWFLFPPAPVTTHLHAGHRAQRDHYGSGQVARGGVQVHASLVHAPLRRPPVSSPLRRAPVAPPVPAGI